MERKRIVVAFGDIIGFRSWTRRASNAPEITKVVIDLFYHEFEKFAETSGLYTKFLGDGIMSVKELADGQNPSCMSGFLEEHYEFAEKVNLCFKKQWPRPSGFRLRISSGYVWKRMIGKGRAPEYIGYAVNMAQGLLSVMPSTLCVCDESIVEIMGAEKSRMVFEVLDVPPDRRTGIDSEDFTGLRSFRTGEKDN